MLPKVPSHVREGIDLRKSVQELPEGHMLSLPEPPLARQPSGDEEPRQSRRGLDNTQYTAAWF